MLAACLAAGHAHAFTIGSPVSEDCHERMTAEALRRVRSDDPSALPVLPPTRDERALIRDLPFPVPDDVSDLGGVALLTAVRDNDLKGNEATDLRRLASVHGDPARQREHCLRSADDSEPDGTQKALASCREFILERTRVAIDALDSEGRPDALQRTRLAVYLGLRHEVKASLPTYYVALGQAVHTLEDSFTHTFRTEDGLHPTVALTWIHLVEGDLDEDVHGPPHGSELDRCDDPDELRKQRRTLATDAAEALIRATVTEGGRDARLAAVVRVLDTYLAYQPGCTAENDWCEAPEHDYGAAIKLNCGMGSRGGRGLGALGLLAGILAVTLCVRRRRPRVATLALAIVVSLPALARAEGPGPQRDAPPSAAQERKDPHALHYGGVAGVSGSFDYGAMAARIGGRARYRDNFVFGLDAEWNPWFADSALSGNNPGVRPGAFNAYLTGMFRVRLVNEAINLRATLHLGTSTLLMDLYGAPRGVTGVFVGGFPLGIEWRASKHIYFVFDPLGLVLPAPQLSGAPLAYGQYRTSFAVELYSD